MRYQRQLNGWCCKPKYIYWADAILFGSETDPGGTAPNGGFLRRNTVASTSDWTNQDVPYVYYALDSEQNGPGDPYAVSFQGFCFDRVNEQLFFAHSLDSGNIYKLDQDPRSRGVKILDAPADGSNILVMDCDPTNQVLFYMTGKNGGSGGGGNWDTIKIRSVEYDGSNPTDLVSNAGMTAHLGGTTNIGYDMQYDKFSGRIYYILPHDDSPGNIPLLPSFQLRRCLADGTLDEQIRGIGDTNYTEFDTTMSGLCIDAANHKVLWCEFNSAASGFPNAKNILQATLTGGSVTSINHDLRGQPFGTDGPPWMRMSQLFNTLYVYDGAASIGLDSRFRRMSPVDGSGIIELWNNSSNGKFGPKAGRFYLGRGEDSVGSGILL